MGTLGSKVNASAARAGGSDVADDLSLQLLDRRKPHLVAEPVEELQANRLTIYITCKIQQMGLDG